MMLDDIILVETGLGAIIFATAGLVYRFKLRDPFGAALCFILAPFALAIFLLYLLHPGH